VLKSWEQAGIDWSRMPCNVLPNFQLEYEIFKVDVDVNSWLSWLSPFLRLFFGKRTLFVDPLFLQLMPAPMLVPSPYHLAYLMEVSHILVL